MCEQGERLCVERSVKERKKVSLQKGKICDVNSKSEQSFREKKPHSYRFNVDSVMPKRVITVGPCCPNRDFSLFTFRK